MDKRQSTRMAVAVLALIVAGLCFWLPVFRVQAVATLGVLTANALSAVIYTVGIASIVLALGVIAISIRQFILNRRAASQKMLEAKEWDVLPSRSEANPELLEPALRRIAHRYPDVAPLIETTFEQLASMRRSLDKIGDIFEANAGIISQEPGRYANVERLIELSYKRFCPGLVRIVYQAHDQDESDTTIKDLSLVITEVNRGNQVRVETTRKLANAVVDAATEGDIDTVTSEVEQATRQLKSNVRRKEWI